MRIAALVAPTALRIAISLGRSTTDTNIILAIPMPPTTKEIPAIAPTITVNKPITLLKVSDQRR
jgi:hypothetical protein